MKTFFFIYQVMNSGMEHQIFFKDGNVILCLLVVSLTIRKGMKIEIKVTLEVTTTKLHFNDFLLECWFYIYTFRFIFVCFSFFFSSFFAFNYSKICECRSAKLRTSNFHIATTFTMLLTSKYEKKKNPLFGEFAFTSRQPNGKRTIQILLITKQVPVEIFFSSHWEIWNEKFPLNRN